jgi:phosphoribosylamine---glycine ligase
MKVLLVGAGGREHAIAWKLTQSPHLIKLYVAPGNPGTAELGENIPLDIDDHANVVRTCHDKQVDLVVIGPETPLAAGLADDLIQAGMKVFGPSQKAAQIESSKAFAKAFMERHQIPTAKYQIFTDPQQALDYASHIDYPIVIKASGLASGKGVIIPETLQDSQNAIKQIMEDHSLGAAGDELVIEERLTGLEVSLLAFCDGKIARPMIPAQDHKRIHDGDQGPNTGGMGAYAPVPICPPTMVEELTKTILQPTIDALADEGRPFIGVLYAGLMLTPAGPKVIEFNCRFGDPETQVILPLLDSDLLDIFLACADGRLKDIDIKWKPGAAACVVLASGGYPGEHQTGQVITGLDTELSHIQIFQAGTKQLDDKIVTAGGRVLCVSGWDKDLEQALSRTYTAIKPISFTGMQYRRDIGHKTLKEKEV